MECRKKDNQRRVEAPMSAITPVSSAVEREDTLEEAPFPGAMSSSWDVPEVPFSVVLPLLLVWPVVEAGGLAPAAPKLPLDPGLEETRDDRLAVVFAAEGLVCTNVPPEVFPGVVVAPD